MRKKGDITIETVITWAIIILMLFVLLILIFKNTEGMKAVWDKILGVFG